jgi:hypothetical protein
MLFVINTQNLQVQTYELKADNHLHKLWHIEEYLDVEQLLDSP